VKSEFNLATIDFLAKTGALLIQLSKLLAEMIFSTLPTIPSRPIDWIIYLPTSAGILVGSKIQVIGKWIIQVEKHGKEGGRNLIVSWFFQQPSSTHARIPFISLMF
jgi:hypothetical protein